MKRGFLPYSHRSTLSAAERAGVLVFRDSGIAQKIWTPRAINNLAPSKTPEKLENTIETLRKQSNTSGNTLLPSLLPAAPLTGNFVELDAVPHMHA